MRKLTKEQNELFETIDNLLWQEWDPIGIHDFAPRDEYQSYVPQIFSLAIHGASIEEIAQRLISLETETIGVSGNAEQCERIAKKIVETKNQLLKA